MKSLCLVLALLAPAESLDWAVQRAVQSHRMPALEGVMRASTDVGRPLVVAVVLGAIAAFDRTGGLRLAATALATLVPTNALVEGLKRLTFRARPDGEHKRSNASFPSGHAANAFAIAWVFSRRWRKLAPGFFAAACLIAISRVYLNRHFTSDVAVGAAIGMACGWFVSWFLQRREALRVPQRS
jgi:undecaprenyl-diphosphatase